MSAAGPLDAQAPGAPADLADRTWPQLAAGPPGVLAVPVGSTEQHGPHLPLSTDTDVATALARALARRRDDVLVAPALAYGSSGEHAGFPGTLSIGQEALELLLVELTRSASAWCPRTLLVVGHGGNAGPVTRAVRTLRAEGRDVTAWGPRWRLDDDRPPDLHAGRAETSLQLHLDPGRVRSAVAAPGSVAGHATDPDALLETLRGGGVVAVSPNGVLGDPAGASAEEGARVLAAAVDDLVRHVDRWRRTGVRPAPAAGPPDPAGRGA